MGDSAADRLQRLEELFRLGVELPTPERTGFARRHSGGDAGFERELLALLSEDEAGTRCFLKSPFGDESSEAEAAPTPTSKMRVGNYALRHKLGEGGMGVVYLAEQDPPLSRRVAIKIVKPGLEAPAILERFEGERRALARMNHPGIAVIYEAGVLDSGRPYFVMEYIDGLPITSWCDTRRLDLDQRIDLFLAVCEAVQHAHQKGLVHRDLKPSNVLVQEVDGIAGIKVIDFGIALDRPAGGSPERHTWGSLAAMAPELIDPSIEDIDTRADVYGLGALLYQLLCGRPPFEAATLGELESGEWLRHVREVEPPPPSQALLDSPDADQIASCRDSSRRRLARRLEGDLEAIHARACQKDRDGRYDTVGGLASDLKRHLEGLPVLARRHTGTYLLGRFVHRNQRAVAAVALLAVTLFAGILGTTWGMLRADRDRSSAIEVTQILAEVLAPGFNLGPNAGGAPRLPELDRLGQRLEAGALSRTPRAEAAVRRALGNGYRVLDELDQAERHLRRGLDLLAAADEVDLEERSAQLAALARVYLDQDGAQGLDLFYVAELGLVRSLQDDHPLVAAGLERLMNAIDSQYFELLPDIQGEIVRAAEANLYAGEPAWLMLAELFAAEGEWTARFGDSDAGLGMLRQALDIRQRELPRMHLDIARSCEQLAWAHLERGALAEAEDFAQRAFAIESQALPEGHWVRARTNALLGAALSERGEDAAAEQLLLDAVNQLTEARGLSHPATSRALQRLVQHFEKNGLEARALPFRRRLARSIAYSETQELFWGPQRLAFDREGALLLEAAEGIDDVIHGGEVDLGTCEYDTPPEGLRALDSALVRLERELEAAAGQRDSLRLLVGRQAPHWASSLPCGAFDAQIRLGRMSIALLEPHSELLGMEYGEALGALARSLLSAGRPAEGLELVAQARAILTATTSEPSYSLRALDQTEMELLATLGRDSEALALGRRSLERCSADFGPDHYMTLSMLGMQTAVLLENGGLEPAVELLRPRLETALEGDAPRPGGGALAWIVLASGPLSKRLGDLASELGRRDLESSIMNSLLLMAGLSMVDEHPEQALELLTEDLGYARPLQEVALTAVVAAELPGSEEVLRTAALDLRARVSRQPHIWLSDRVLIDRALALAPQGLEARLGEPAVPATPGDGTR